MAHFAQPKSVYILCFKFRHACPGRREIETTEGNADKETTHETSTEAIDNNVSTQDQVTDTNSGTKQLRQTTALLVIAQTLNFISTMN